MTNLGPRKPVDVAHATARRLQAREFRESARSLVTLGQNRSYNGAITLMVAAAIAYADAVTAQTKGIVNKVLHTPISTLKSAAREAKQKDPEATTIIELVRKLFNLSSARTANAEASRRDEASDLETNHVETPEPGAARQVKKESLKS